MFNGTNLTFKSCLVFGSEPSSTAILCASRKSFCHLLIPFANSLDPDQDQHPSQSFSASKPFDTLIVFLTEFFQKSNFEKKSTNDYKSMKITLHAHR